MTAGDRALILLEKLLRIGEWYISAIELDQHTDESANGEELEKEARRIMSAKLLEDRKKANNG